MQPTVVLSILLLLSLVQKQSAIHVLNTTAYSAFYATSCTRSSPSDVYPVSCNPFNTSSLWLPSTIVYNGTVNISSDSLLTFVVSTLPSPLFFALSSLLIVVLLHLYPLNISFKIPEGTTTTVGIVMLYGSVNLLIEGNLIASPEAYNASSIIIQHLGNLQVEAYATTLHDQASIVLFSGALKMKFVTAYGTNTSLILTGGMAYIHTVQDITNVYIGGNVSMVGFDISTASLYISGYPFINTLITVTKYALVNGGVYLQYLVAAKHSSVFIHGCTNIGVLEALQDATITYYYDSDSTTCTLGSLPYADRARINFVGSSDLQITVSPELFNQGILSFTSSAAHAVNISMVGEETGFSNLEFNGTFSVYAGNQDGTFLLAGSNVVAGTVNFFAVSVQLTGDFKITPNFNFILQNQLYLLYCVLDLLTISWSTGGTMLLGDNSTAFSRYDYVLGPGKKIVLESTFGQAPNFKIASGGSLVVASPLGAINGNVIVDGLLAFSQSSGGAASLASSVLSVNGTLVINSTGVLDLPQRLSPDFYASLASQVSSLINVFGTVHLGGTLIVTLGGKLLPHYTSENISKLAIPMVVSTHVIGHMRYTSFNSSISPATISEKLSLDYRVTNNTLYLCTRSTKHDNTAIYIGGILGSIAFLVLLVVIVLYFRYRRNIYVAI